MKIAVPYEEGKVFQHFGHCERFRIYDAEGGKIVKAETCPTNGAGHGALAAFLQARGVEALLCGGIGGGAIAALKEAGIAVYPGVSGDADARTEEFLAGALAYDPDAKCSHHEEKGHDCGSHEHHCGSSAQGGCGSHGCGR